MSTLAKRAIALALAAGLLGGAAAASASLRKLRARARHDALAQAADGARAQAQDAIRLRLASVEAQALAAASLPILRAQIGVVDAKTLRDGFRSESWWAPIRREFPVYGLALDGDDPEILEGAEVGQLALSPLVRGARDKQRASALVPLKGAGLLLAAGAAVDRPGGGSVPVLLLARPFDGAALSELAARVHDAVLLSDGKTTLLASGEPEAQAQLRLSVGEETQGLQEGGTWSASAAALGPGLYLWVRAAVPDPDAGKLPFDVLGVWALASAAAIIVLVFGWGRSAARIEPRRALAQEGLDSAASASEAPQGGPPQDVEPAAGVDPDDVTHQALRSPLAGSSGVSDADRAAGRTGVSEPGRATGRTGASNLGRAAGRTGISNPGGSTGRTGGSTPGRPGAAPRNLRPGPTGSTGPGGAGRTNPTGTTGPDAPRTAAPGGRPATHQFGRYFLLDQLGEGGMAEVYTAVAFGAENFRRPFVVKLLRTDAVRTESLVNMFIDEAKLASGLIHSNIIPVFDFGKVGDEYFIAQEYILGRDLRRVTTRAIEVDGHPLPQRLVIFIAREILRALEYAHTRLGNNGKPLGIVHRDVSPNNILVSARGEVKLFDFGIAKADEGRLTQTQTGVVKGNIRFMSPEQSRGEHVDARADIASLTLVLYFALTGKPLYEGENSYMILMQAAQGLTPETLVRLQALPAPLPELIRRGLEPDREKRFQSAAELEHALSALPTGNGAELAREMARLFGDELQQEEGRFASVEPPADDQGVDAPLE